MIKKKQQRTCGPMDFLDRLKKARKEKGVSQAELSRVIGMSESMYGLYETRQRVMSVESFQKICQYLCVSADEILDLKQGPSAQGPLTP